MAWDQILAIAAEAAAEARTERSTPPEACPNDGEPLEAGPDGTLFCPFDGWRPDGQ